MKLIINGETAQIPTGGGAGSGGIPTGGIIIWSGAANAVPDGWALCDGENGTPDLRDRFVLCAGTSHAVGSTGGSEEVTLTADQSPKHTHYMSGFNYDQSTTVSTPQIVIDAHIVGNSISRSTNYFGGSQPHPNMPPYYTLAYIMKL